MKTTKLKPVTTTRTIWAIKRVRDGKYFSDDVESQRPFFGVNGPEARNFGTEDCASLWCSAGEIPVHLSITDKTFTTIREIK